MRNTKQVEFPAIKDFFEMIMKSSWRIHGEGDPVFLTNESLATESGIEHPQYISYFRNGLRAPTESQSKAIASTLFGKANSKKKAEFLNDLKTAAEHRAPKRSGNFLQDLAEGTATLEISSVDFPPIAGGADCAFESLTDRFLGLCGIRPRTLPHRTRLNAAAYTDKHFLLAVFDSPDRMLSLKFYRTPIRLTLGCICHETHRRQWDSIASALSDPNSRDRQSVRPIVLMSSVGAIHCQKRLKFAESQISPIERTGLNVDTLAKRLVDETRDRPNVVPIVCVDELLSFKVLNSPLLAGQGFSVFDMNSQRAARNSDLRREMPQHYMSFAIKRERNDDFQDYVQDALTHFLSTEPETTAILWCKLAKQLLDEICSLTHFPQTLTTQDVLRRAERWRHAWEWVQYTLHLDRASIESFSNSSSLPWRPVLLRARTLMQTHFAESMTILQDQVKLSIPERRDGQITSDELKRLYDLFDVELSTVKQPEDEKEAIHNLHLALLGSYRSLGIVIRECDAAASGQADLFATRGFLRSIQAMYESMGRPESAKRINDDIDRLSDVYGGKKGRILLATSPDGGTSVALGVVFLDIKDIRKSEEAELRFMWVRPVYRRHGVGSRLVAHGLELAKSLGCKSIRVEILPELQEAIDLVQRHGFVRSAERTSLFPGRAVLERQL